MDRLPAMSGDYTKERAAVHTAVNDLFPRRLRIQG